ncbi:MAG: transcriptional regulator NrdR [Coriobacteriia bacterium]|nr:transcriptional regulator NrdR [Coriobacteriia bacterium]MCL2746252.1 transcriptional regulator NrdR [Coriobacteriia bacterium]MCL2871127.1 transcriptional regulator NrdR [Coriobacteriia bacterium]
MNCPKCGHVDSKVIDSRASESQDAIRRRRECLECGTRFTTYERREEQPLVVIKRDGSREPFDFQKLRRGLMVAAAKRPISGDDIDILINDIRDSLQSSFRFEVESATLGDMVLLRLKNLDFVAYVRFASVYKDFRTVEEFTGELAELS